jgi:hypothetical protein
MMRRIHKDTLRKKEVQQLVTLNGAMLPLNEFHWDRRTKTFYTELPNLVISFDDIDDCTFYLPHYITLTAGDRSTVKAGSYSTINVGCCSYLHLGSHCDGAVGGWSSIRAEYLNRFMRDSFKIEETFDI